MSLFLQVAAAVLAIVYYSLIDEFLVNRFAEYEAIPKTEGNWLKLLNNSRSKIKFHLLSLQKLFAKN